MDPGRSLHSPFAIIVIVKAALILLLASPSLVYANALTDLQSLKDTINDAAKTIGSPDNPGRGWGLLPPKGVPGTADLVQNITNSVLKIKFNLDSERLSWLNGTNPIVNGTIPTITTSAAPSRLPTSTLLFPTGPSSAPIIPPSAPNGLPPNLPPTANLTGVSLDNPYLDYITAIPTLSGALIDLGRAWHREMNTPVRQAVQGLQLSINAFSTSLLESDLIHSNATIRTIRASTSLENAKLAWSRLLNFPGGTPPGQGNASITPGTGRMISSPSVRRAMAIAQERVADSDTDFDTESDSEAQDAKRAPVANRPFRIPPIRYSHKDLWNRDQETQEGAASRKRAVTF